MNTGAMRNSLKLLIPALLATAVAAHAHSKHPMATKPLTPDQVAVYRAFLDHYLSEDFGLKGMLNIAKTTTPFKADASDLNGGCLKDFTPLPVATGVHAFTNQFAGLKNVRVVDARETTNHGISDPQTNTTIFHQGLFTFSEVAFDPTRHYAAISYSFERPGFGNSGTYVFKLDHGTWRPTLRLCSGSGWSA